MVISILLTMYSWLTFGGDLHTVNHVFMATFGGDLHTVNHVFMATFGGDLHTVNHVFVADVWW